MTDAPVAWNTMTVALSIDAVTKLVTATLPLVAAASLVQGVRVWYANGSTFSIPPSSWTDLPLTGLQVAMIYQNQKWDNAGLKPYRHIVSGADFYQTDNAVLAALIGTLILDTDYKTLVDA